MIISIHKYIVRGDRSTARIQNCLPCFALMVDSLSCNHSSPYILPYLQYVAICRGIDDNHEPHMGN